MELFIAFSIPSLDPLAAASGVFGLATVIWFVIIGKKDTGESGFPTPIKPVKKIEKKRRLFGRV